MDDDEVFFLVIASILALVGLSRWYLKLIRLDRLHSSVRIRVFLAVAPLLCLLGVWPVLKYESDPQVATQPQYLALFMMGAGMWLLMPMLVLPILGMSPALDAMERSNGPAAMVCASGLASASIVYAWANIGIGATIWTTLIPAAIGAAVLAGAWFIHRMLSPAWEDVAVGRDHSAGIRLGAFVIATAIVIAPPLAGNWVSVEATWNDIVRRGWPILPLIVTAAVLDRWFTPTKSRPRPPILQAGVIAGAAELAIASIAAMGLR